MHEDMENLTRTIKKMTYLDPVDSMSFKDDEKD
jgi:hypothetical protein